MGFKKQDGDNDANQSDREAREARIAFQQFLNQNASIFTAMARRGIGVKDERFFEIGARLAETGRDVAIEVAALVEDVPPGKASEDSVRAVRPDVVDYVVERWLSGETFDVAVESRAIATILRQADSRFDFNPYKRTAQAGPDTSVALSFIGAAALLSCMTLPYDFRAADPAGLPGRMLDAVVETARDHLPRLIMEDCPEAESKTVLQSLVKHFAKLMKAVYEREVEAMVMRAQNMDEDARRQWFETHDPIGSIIDDFRDRAKNLMAIADAKLNQTARAPAGRRPRAA